MSMVNMKYTALTCVGEQAAGSGLLAMLMTYCQIVSCNLSLSLARADGTLGSLTQTIARARRHVYFWRRARAHWCGRRREPPPPPTEGGACPTRKEMRFSINCSAHDVLRTWRVIWYEKQGRGSRPRGGRSVGGGRGGRPLSRLMGAERRFIEGLVFGP